MFFPRSARARGTLASKRPRVAAQVEYAAMWRASSNTYGAWLRDHPGPAHTHFLKFERLADPRTRVAALEAALAFARASPRDAGAVACAFPRADNPAMHRRHDASLVNGTVAWSARLVAAVWRQVGGAAGRLGYTEDSWRTREPAAPVDAAALFAVDWAKSD